MVQVNLSWQPTYSTIVQSLVRYEHVNMVGDKNVQNFQRNENFRVVFMSKSYEMIVVN